MTRITVARAGEAGLHAPLLDSMFRLRADVFHGRLGWDVRVEGGREHDWFDLIGPHYLVARAAGDTALQVGTGLSDRYGSSLDGGPVIALSRGLAGLTP